MDIETLKALGMNTEELGDRIVDQAVSALLRSTGFDPENDVEVTYDTQFKKQINERIKAAIDNKISALAEKHVVPMVGDLIEKTNFQSTNGYGEPKGPAVTFREYIVSLAEKYMSDDVDYNGRSKQESKDSYNWSKDGPRLMVLMKMYIRETMEKAAKSAVNDVNKESAKSIANAALDAIQKTVASIKVSVQA
jgi:hypothetical protein